MCIVMCVCVCVCVWSVFGSVFDLVCILMIGVCLLVFLVDVVCLSLDIKSVLWYCQRVPKLWKPGDEVVVAVTG